MSNSVTIGNATLYHGDCLEILLTLPKVDAVVTDPVWPNCPLGLLAGSERPESLLNDALQIAQTSTVVIVLGFDSDPRYLNAVPEVWPFIRPQQLPYAVPSYAGRLLRGDEVAYVFGEIPKGRGVIPGRARAVTSHKADRATGHPCPRADDHMRQLCAWWSPVDGVVLDPFMGTGATGVGAVQAGRNFIGIEIEKKYFDIACERIDQAQRQGEDVRVRDYGRVFCALWTSPDFRGLSEDARALALYLLTSPHGTIIGAFALPDGYAAEDMQWTKERVSKGFVELFAKGFANRCAATKWVWICKFLEWNPPENPNQWKAAGRKAAAKLPDQCSWASEFKRDFAILAGDEPEPEQEPYPNPSETVSKSIAVTAPVTESESGSKNGGDVPRRTSDSDSAARVFAHWKTTHRHPRAKLDAPRRKLIHRALDSYSEADLCQSITGYLNSPHHMGQNDKATVYDDIGLMLRDAKHIDAGLKFYAAPPSNFSPKTRQLVAQTDDWTPPETRRAAN